MTLEGRLDFELAWERVKEDLRKVCFCDNPYIVNIAEANRTKWLDYIKSTFKNPTIPPVVDIPKKNWHIRPASMLTVQDQVIYSALLLDGIEEIKNALEWSSNKKRFSYVLKRNQKTKYWLEYGWYWKNFNTKSIELAHEYDYVLITDIAGYFENINIKRLISDLDSLGFEKDAKTVLNDYLNAWAPGKQKGIPQGYTTSSILAEVYLDSIDKNLEREGIEHTRYVDDMRIFCESHSECVNALQLLTRSLREKELNIQTAKSDIHNKDEAINIIEGITPIIDGIDQKIKNKLKSIPEYQITNELIRKEEGLNLERTFKEYIIDQKSQDFNKTLFHYLINKIKTPMAAYYCLNLLFERPEETKYIFDYFSRLHYENFNMVNVAEQLAKEILLENETQAISEYQKYLFIKWLYTTKIKTDTIISAVRKVINGPISIPATLDYSIAYLGENGDVSEFDFLSSKYSTFSDVCKATAICGLQQMERSRRNTLYGRARGNGDLLEFAVNYAKSI